MDVVYVAGIVACTGLIAALIRLCVRLSRIRQVGVAAAPVTPRVTAETRRP
ncbi:hypothetical protein [Chitinasiproducens palmae]|uniref:Uncharacterized protein n=1 Tax=Chitinasiproducens palmae TaxID=1770053 RepID=A0A1H2PKV0_9BURK|nr:hypothetical protein [Chitinasiproducens palmae]SDV47079.1 hypothetical protein SAMN05216551_102252 [Chitinasiproducens palmae]